MVTRSAAPPSPPPPWSMVHILGFGYMTVALPWRFRGGLKGGHDLLFLVDILQRHLMV